MLCYKNRVTEKRREVTLFTGSLPSFLTNQITIHFNKLPCTRPGRTAPQQNNAAAGINKPPRVVTNTYYQKKPVAKGKSISKYSFGSN
jgi:hypothetical protein